MRCKSWRWWGLAAALAASGCEDWTRISVDRSDDDPPSETAAEGETEESPVGETPETDNASTAPFELANVRWLHTDVSGWPVTTTLNARIRGGSIILEYDKARVWPAVTGENDVNANPWIFVQRDGVWYAATWEWLRFGQTSKPTTVVNGAHIKRSPLNDFQPVSGETYGFMVSGLARTDLRNVRERSNVVMLVWP